MQGVVYCTRSVIPNENETVVIRSIDIVNTIISKKVSLIFHVYRMIRMISI